jgi:hypothetical protein
MYISRYIIPSAWVTHGFAQRRHMEPDPPTTDIPALVPADVVSTNMVAAATALQER